MRSRSGRKKLPTCTGKRYRWDSPVWRSIPAPLAIVDGERVVARNLRCRRVLEDLLGPDEAVWDRWLTAAVVRLRIDGAERRTFAVAPDDPRRVDLFLGDPWDESDQRIVVLRPVDADAHHAADLIETVSTLSHEFRTPLAAMKSSLGLLTRGEAGPLNDDQQRFLEMTVRNIDRLDRLVRDLLDAARADAGRLPLHLREVDLAPILAEALSLHRRDAQETGLVLETGPLPMRFAATVDPDKVLQMLSNVVGNAVKYCHRGDHVRIEVQSEVEAPEGRGADREWFALTVRDTGPGIDPGRQAAIFAPFCRAHDESDGRVFGAGLGLHITRGLVEAHGGHIELQSEPGEGTTVTITLPRSPQRVETRPAEAEEPELVVSG